MSDEEFVPFTKERKEMFKTHLFWYEKYLSVIRKLKNAQDAWNESRTYLFRLRDRGIDPESEIFLSIKSDESLIIYFLKMMDSYLVSISKQLDILYCFVLSTREDARKKFDDIEKSIVSKLDIVSLLESRYMKRRQVFVNRCLDALSSTRQIDLISRFL